MTTPESMIEKLAAELAAMASGSAKTKRAGRQIRDAAEHRRGVVQSEADGLRARVLTDPDAADAYQNAVLERGTLDRVASS